MKRKEGEMMDSLHLMIDGKAVEAEKGTTLLRAAKSVGIEIPTHCYDDNLQSYGACRMCLVEITRNGRKRLVAACLYEVEEGLVVKTRTREIEKIRRTIIELTWPSMSKYAEEYGARDDRFEVENDDCTLCGKCTRFCEQSRLADIVYFRGRGINRKLELIPNSGYEFDIYKQCMSLCPGGRLMDKLVNLWSQ